MEIGQQNPITKPVNVRVAKLKVQMKVWYPFLSEEERNKPQKSKCRKCQKERWRLDSKIQHKS